MVSVISSVGLQVENGPNFSSSMLPFLVMISLASCIDQGELKIASGIGIVICSTLPTFIDSMYPTGSQTRNPLSLNGLLGWIV
jgi:hypothetical protein